MDEESSPFNIQVAISEITTLQDALKPYLAEKVEKGKMTPEMRKALENIGYLSPEE